MFGLTSIVTLHLMECCMEHIIDKCRDEYTYYISEFTGIEYDEVFDTVMNE